MNDEIKVLSVNCQGLRDFKKRYDVLEYLNSSDANIFCLQDTHWLSKDVKLIKQIWNGECLVHGVSTNSRGVAILFKKNIEYEILSHYNDDLGNLISADLKLSSIYIKLINIYAPNNDSPSFFQTIAEIINSSEQPYTILCGDFNVPLNTDIDTYNYKKVNNPKARIEIHKMMSNLNLADAFRIFNPTIRRYTWHRKKPFQKARLDYFLVSNTLMDFVVTCTIQPGYRTDHSIVQMTLVTCKFVKGKGIWKFNCSLLKNTEYVNMINSLIDSEKKFYSVLVYSHEYLNILEDSDVCFRINDAQFLEVLLLKIRGETIKFATKVKRQLDTKEKNLISDIKTLENLNTLSSGDLLDDKKRELQDMREQKLKGNIVRSRAQWLHNGEKPSFWT